jgi:hypothetical protein
VWDSWIVACTRSIVRHTHTRGSGAGSPRDSTRSLTVASRSSRSLCVCLLSLSLSLLAHNTRIFSNGKPYQRLIDGLKDKGFDEGQGRPIVMNKSAADSIKDGWITEEEVEVMKERILKDRDDGLTWEDDIPHFKSLRIVEGQPYKEQVNTAKPYHLGMSNDEFMIAWIIEGNHR